MYMGYRFSTRSGSSIGVNDFAIPDNKSDIISRAVNEVKEIEVGVLLGRTSTVVFVRVHREPEAAMRRAKLR